MTSIRGILVHRWRLVASPLPILWVPLFPPSRPRGSRSSIGPVPRCGAPGFRWTRQSPYLVDDQTRMVRGYPPPGSRDITALEQSFLDHIEAFFAQRSSLQEDIGRIRRHLDDPHRESIMPDVCRWQTCHDGEEEKREKAEGGGGTEVSSSPLPSP